MNMVTNEGAKADMKGGVSSIYTCGDWPWQGKGFGEHSEKPVSVEEALKLSGMDWLTEQTPVYYGDEKRQALGVVANVRGDTGDILGIVSDRYKPIHNRDGFAFGDAILDFGAHIDSAVSLDGGRRTAVVFRLPDIDILGDTVADFLFVANFHDGRGCLQAGGTKTRVVCRNTFDRALKNAVRVWKLRHIGKSLESQLATASEILEMNNSYTKALKEQAEALSLVKLTAPAFDSVLEKLFPLPEDASNVIKLRTEESREAVRIASKVDNLANFAGTGWGLLQAVSDVAYHKQPTRRTDTYGETLSAFAMDGHPLVQKAWDILLPQ